MTILDNVDLTKLKQIAPKLGKLSHSSPEATAVFAALLARSRSHDVTDLRMWHWNITTKGVKVQPANTKLFDRLEKSGLGVYVGQDDKGLKIFRFILEYPAFVSILKKTADAGAGSFIESTEDTPERFKWGYSIRHVALAARFPDDVDSIQKHLPRRKSAKERKKELQQLVKISSLGKNAGVVALFTQKDGCTMRLEFPRTFSSEERNRLAEFIMSIPIS